MCKYRHSVIDMCIATGLKFAKFRILGVSAGELTCHTYNGRSLIDYVLVDNMVLPQLGYPQGPRISWGFMRSLSSTLWDSSLCVTQSLHTAKNF